MKIELDGFQTADILKVFRQEYRLKKLYFIEHPNDTEGITTLEDIRKLHDCILEQAHNKGELNFLDPIIIN